MKRYWKALLLTLIFAFLYRFTCDFVFNSLADLCSIRINQLETFVSNLESAQPSSTVSMKTTYGPDGKKDVIIGISETVGTQANIQVEIVKTLVQRLTLLWTILKNIFNLMRDITKTLSELAIASSIILGIRLKKPRPRFFMQD